MAQDTPSGGSSRPPLQKPISYAPRRKTTWVPGKGGGRFYAEYNLPPEDWAKKVGYQPSYWEQPQRIARYYHTLKALPPEAEPPPWINKEEIDFAYKYLEQQNQGAPWWQWKMLDARDPGRQFLQNIQQPPDDALWPGERRPRTEEWYRGYRSGTSGFQGPYSPEFYRGQQDALKEAQAPLQPTGPYQPAEFETLPQPGQGGLTQEQFESLKPWQKGLAWLGGQNPMIQAGALGAIIGAPGGLPGMAVGTGLGLGMGALSQMSPAAANWMMKLDYPAEWLERAFGALALGYGRGVKEWQEKGFQASTDVVADVLNNLPAAFKASHLFYETLPIGRTWQATSPIPVPNTGWSAFNEAYERIRDGGPGNSPEEVWSDVSARMGITGQGRELLGHIIFDPLNVIGGLGVGAELAYAATRGDEILKMAAMGSRGPVDALRQYGALLRRYTPGEEIAKMGTLARFFGGVDKTGKPLEVFGKGGKGPLNYVLQLTPQARANEVVNNHAEITMGLLDKARDAAGNFDPRQALKFLHSLANAPVSTARALSMRVLRAPDAAALPLVLRDNLQKLDNIGAAWDASQPRLQALTKLGELTGRSIDEIVVELADEAGAKRLLSQVQDIASRSTDPAAQDLLLAMQGPRPGLEDISKLDAPALVDLAKPFQGKDGLATRPEMVQAQMSAMLDDLTADWAVKWFGVKPDPSWLRMSNTIKTAQSIMLLGFNPVYYLNNAINNRVTVLAEGLFGMRNKAQIADVWKRAGIVPPRLRAGVGIDAAGIEQANRILKDATIQPGALQNITRNLEKTKRWQVFGRLSGWDERLSSEQALTSGFMQFMGRNWRRDKGFRSMPPALEERLAAINPNLPRAIYSAIESGLSQAEIEQKIWQGLSRRSVLDATPEIARRTGMPEADVAEVLHNVGATSPEIAERLSKAADDTEVNAILHEVESKAQQHLDDLSAQNLEMEAAKAANRVDGEGYQATLDIFDQMSYDYSEHWFNHFVHMDEAAQLAENLVGSAKGLVWENAFADAQRSWQRLNRRQEAQMAGIARGLGLDSDAARRSVGYLEQQHQTWGEFYRFRDEMYRLLNSGEATWTEVSERLYRRWEESYAKQEKIFDAMDAEYVKLFTDKFGEAAGQAATAWRKGIKDIREQMHKDMLEHRAMGATGWREFLQGPYFAGIRALYEQNVEGARRVWEAASGRPAPAAGPAPEPPRLGEADWKLGGSNIEEGRAAQAAREAAQAAPEAAPPAAISETQPPPAAALTPEGRVQTPAEIRLRNREIAREMSGGILAVEDMTKPAKYFDGRILAAINEGQPTKYTDLADVPEDAMRAGLQRWLDKHAGEPGYPEVLKQAAIEPDPYVAEQAQLMEAGKVAQADWADDINKAVEPDQRIPQDPVDNAIQVGQIRKTLRQDFISYFLSGQDNVLANVADAGRQADATIALLDAHANVWAKNTGRTPLEWYQTHIAEVSDTAFTPEQAARNRLIGQYTRLNRTISEEHATAMVALMEANARYLGKSFDEYVNNYIRDITFGGSPEEHALYKLEPGDPDWDSYRNYLNEHPELVTGDVDAYMKETASWIRQHTSDVAGESALRPNSKTLMSVDFSGECPLTASGKSCLECYVEEPRATASPQANVRFGSAPYTSDKILSMPQGLVDFMNDRLGGLRVNSITDLRPQDVPLMHQLIGDAKQRGLGVKVITKQPNTLKEFLRPEYDHVIFNMSVDWLPENFGKAFEPLMKERLTKIWPDDPGRVSKAIKDARFWLTRANAEIAYGFRMGNPPEGATQAVKETYANYWKNLKDANGNLIGKRAFTRSVAMNPEDAILHIDNPDIDVVTMWHGTLVEPEMTLELFRIKNADLMGIGKNLTEQLVRNMDEMFSGDLPEGVTIRDLFNAKRFPKLPVSERIRAAQKMKVGDKIDDLRDYIKRIRDERAEALWEEGMKGEVWQNMIAAGKVPPGPPPATGQEIYNLGSAVYPRPKKPGWKLSEDPAYIAIKDIRDPGAGITLQTPVPVWGVEGATGAGGFDRNTTFDELTNHLMTFTYKPRMSEDSAMAIGSVWKAKKPGKFLNRKLNSPSLARQKYIEDLIGRKFASRQEYEDFLDIGLNKTCCANSAYDVVTPKGNVEPIDKGRCSLCGLKCGKRYLHISPKADKQGVAEESFLRVISGEPLASIAFDLDNRAVMRAFTESANVTDMTHELGHLFRRTLKSEDLSAFEAEMKVESGHWSRQHEEQFADLFEKYLSSGKAPTPQLARVFEQFKNWIVDIYRSLVGKENLKVSPEMQRIFDKMLGGEVVEPYRPAAAPQKLYQQPTTGPVWYSQLQHTIQNIQQERMGVDQLRGMITKGGAKADEIKWTGLDDYLEGKKNVTKSEVLDYLRQNEVRVEEVVRGGRDKQVQIEDISDQFDELVDPSFHLRVDAIYRVEFPGDDDGHLAWTVYKEPMGDGTFGYSAYQNGNYRNTFESLDEVQMFADEYANYAIPATRTRYSTYALPGGENYREMLLTLPGGERPSLEWRTNRQGMWAWFDGDTQVSQAFPLHHNREAARASIRAESRPGYQSPHWEEPNVLAHVRFDDRVDADGKKVLFIEEVQSDWHQAGREKGYATTDQLKQQHNDLNRKFAQLENQDEYLRGLNAEVEAQAKIRSETDWDKNYEGWRKAGRRIEELSEQRVEYLKTQPWAQDIIKQQEEIVRLIGEGGGVPAAPFSKTWPDLAIKRMLRWAAENGYDRVAFPTGPVAARIEGHQLIEGVETLRYYPEAGDIQFKPKGEGFRISKIEEGKKLEDYVGYDAAQQLKAGTPNERGYVELATDDIVFGGENMRWFYDRDLVNNTNKLLKKWGTKVGETELETRGRILKPYRDESTGMWAIREGGLDIGLEFETQADAYRYVRENKSANYNVHSIDITPEMKASVMHGQPLFQGARGSVEFLDDGRAIIKALASPDVSTLAHEIGHVFRRDLTPDDLAITEKWAGVVDSRWDVDAEEKFAKGFEKYLSEGKAPSQALANVFEQFKTWIAHVYARMREYFTGSEINDEMRGVYDRLLAENPDAADYNITTQTGRARETFSQEGQPPAVEFEDGRQAQLNNNPPDPVKNPLGAVDSLHNEAPVHRIEEDGYAQQVQPVLDGLRSHMNSPESTLPAEVTDLKATLDQDTARQLRGYLGGVYGQQSDMKLAGVRVAGARRDAALLNYSRRRGFDNLLTAVFPYNFWYTRNAINWALRIIDKPSWLANYYRLRSIGAGTQENEGYPRRLKNKMKIPLPFLPDWAGGGMYVDPMRQIFPFMQIARPFEQISEQNNMMARRAQFVLENWAEEETEDPRAITQAIQTKAGPLWDKAMAQAKLEIDEEVENPVDFVNTIFGMNLPMNWAYQTIMGRPERIGPLPTTRMVKGVTAMMGANEGRGYNLEGPLRRAIGLPEYDRFTDYRVDSMLGYMAAEGLIDTDTARQAMIDRGQSQDPDVQEAFIEAERRIAQKGAMSLVGGPFQADLFPEGEQRIRAIKGEYSKAAEAWRAGDDEALTKFFDKYPEYEARLALFKDPDQRLKGYLIGEVWDRYMGLPDLHRRQAAEQMGQLFEEAFLDKETRSYDSIDANTLAMWARQLGGESIRAVEEAPQAGLDLANPELTAAYQTLQDERDARWPDIGSKTNLLYNLPAELQDSYRAMNPEIGEYEDWRTQYLAQNPAVIPYAIGEENKVAGARPEIQALYYQYLAQRDKQFPGVFELQDAYYDNNKPKGFLKANPMLPAYWDWRREYMKQYPEMIPYIMSTESLTKAVLGDQAAPTQASYTPTNTVYLTPQEIQEYSPALIRQLVAYYYANTPLGTGASKELRRLWERSGRGGTFDDYLAGPVQAMMVSK